MNQTHHYREPKRNSLEKIISLSSRIYLMNKKSTLQFPCWFTYSTRNQSVLLLVFGSVFKAAYFHLASNLSLLTNVQTLRCLQVFDKDNVFASNDRIRNFLPPLHVLFQPILNDSSIFLFNNNLIKLFILFLIT